MNLNLIDRKGKHFFLNLLTANSGNELTELKELTKKVAIENGPVH